MINLHESMGPGRDRTRNPWISSQTRICCQTRYRLRCAARYLIRLISFIIDVPRPLRNEILDHSISKCLCVSRKMSHSVRNTFRDSLENFVPYYSKNIRLKIIHYTCCLNLSSVGKRLKIRMQQVLALRQSRYFFKYLRLL